MKILHITPAYHPAIQWGGPVVSVRILAKEQKKLGHSVEVYTTTLGLSSRKTQSVEVDGLTVHYFDFFTIKRWFVSFPLLRALWKNRDTFDVFDIHLVWDPVCWMSGLILAMTGKKIVISPHGTVEKTLIYRRSKNLKLFVYYVFLRPMFKRVAGFRFTAPDERDKFFQFTGLEAVHQAVVINPFKRELFESPAQSEEFDELGLEHRRYFLCLSRVNWKKRLEIFIDAFSLFVKRYPEHKLVIAGATDEEYGYFLKKRAEEAGIFDHCVFVFRPIPGDSPLKVALFQNAYAFVLPSFSENFGFVAVEALASGTPLIVSDGVAIKDLITKYGAGCVFKGSNLDDREAGNNLLQEMEKVVVPRHREKMIANGKLLVKAEFDNARIAQQVIDLYQGN